MVRKSNPKRARSDHQQALPFDPPVEGSRPAIVPIAKNNKSTASEDSKNCPGQVKKGPATLPVKAFVEDSFNSSANPLKKRPRPDEEDDDGLTDTVAKRPKINSNTRLIHRSAEPEEHRKPYDASVTASQAFSTLTVIPALPLKTPAEVLHLQSKYDFTTMSILSSAKIEVKVRNVLFRVGKFSFADVKAKPGVAILHAYADCANKMVSIVEIAKSEIQKEKGRWYQYSKLEGALRSLKLKQPKKGGPGRTIAEWANDKDHTGQNAKAHNAIQTGEECVDTTKISHEGMAGRGDHGDTEVYFETMVPPKKGTPFTPDAGEGKKVRNVPFMTIYFARVSVPGLKALYL